MNRSLYIFNPEHDLALANGDPNFNAPLQARKMASDLSALPLWFATSGSFVAADTDAQWLENMQMLFPQLKNITIFSPGDNTCDISGIEPWGWDAAVVNQLLLKNISPNLLLSPDQLTKIRALSHRNISIRAVKFVTQDFDLSGSLPLPALELDDILKVNLYIKQNHPAVIKSPWSGSGKGLIWAESSLTKNYQHRVQNIIEKQGSVIVEPIYDKVLDFAMLFHCVDDIAQFSGYSLFETERGFYRSNRLMDDNQILRQITDSGIKQELLQYVREKILQFIQNEIVAFYSGVLGVDMLVYRDNGNVKLHPCIEINLRNTMGNVAQLFYKKFMLPGRTGKFYIDYSSRAEELWLDHQHRNLTFPLQVEAGRIKSGYFSLNNITPETRYRARVEVE